MLELLFIMAFQAATGDPAEPAQQPQATQEQSANQQQAAAPDDRHVRRCRTQAVTGSRLGSRVCHSQAEDDALTEEARDMLRDSMRMWDNQSSPGGNVVCDRPGC